MMSDDVFVVSSEDGNLDYFDNEKIEMADGPVVIKAKPLKNNRFNFPVDIIIPYHGQYEKVNQLLDSIFRLTRSNYYRVTVVDDASPNENFIKNMAANAEKRSRRTNTQNIFQPLRSRTQKGFAGAIKAGWEKTNFPYVCFINSDCVVKFSNWLDVMGSALLKYKDEGVKMVSARTNNPVNGSDWQRGDKEEFVEDVILGKGDHLSMYCFMCHRDLFDSCGGFIKEYPYGWYEDEEFAYRMNKSGYRQAVVGSSWIYHEGEVTVKSVQRNNPEIQNLMFENRNRCLEDMKKISSLG